MTKVETMQDNSTLKIIDKNPNLRLRYVMLYNTKAGSSGRPGPVQQRKTGDGKASAPPVSKSVNFDTAEKIAKLLSMSTEALYRIVQEEESNDRWHR